MTPAFPKRGPDAGTTGKVRPPSGPWHQTTLNVDWSTLSSSDPIRWRPRADPVQKHDPGERNPRKWKCGIDKPRPVTEARMERSVIRGALPALRRGACHRAALRADPLAPPCG